MNVLTTTGCREHITMSPHSNLVCWCRPIVEGDGDDWVAIHGLVCISHDTQPRMTVFSSAG